MEHGTRQQATWSSDVYRAYGAASSNNLAKHYKDNSTSRCCNWITNYPTMARDRTFSESRR